MRNAVLVLLASCAALLMMGSASATAQTAFYASPTGSGSTCSKTNPCSLVGARNKVRTVNASMTNDIVVELGNGVYPLTSPFELQRNGSVDDSGTNGYDVIYRASPGGTAILSGGQAVTGWSLWDTPANIWRANVGTSVDFRQLYINGVRAIRAQGRPATFTLNTGINGFTASNSVMASWGNKQRIELMGRSLWKSFRCPVQSITGTSVVLQDECFDNSQNHVGGANFTGVFQVENAYELLDQAGEWYLDRTAGYLYYKPRAGENLATAEVIRPQLQTLVRMDGTPAAPLRNITLSGLQFSYSNWTNPNSSDGYVPLQAGFYQEGNNPTANNFNVTKTPGAVVLRGTSGAEIDRNTFTRLGATGVTLDDGAVDNAITGNIFEDISSAAVGLGEAGGDANDPPDPAAQVRGNAITDNYVTDIGVEYEDAAAITVAYAKETAVAHNLIEEVPYTGISVGWGFGLRPSYMSDNHVTGNRILNHLKVLADGGAIYTVGEQPNSTISGNFASGQYAATGMLYLDEQTKAFVASSNVFGPTHTNWLRLQSNSTGNTVTGNYTSTTTRSPCSGCNQHGNTVTGNTEGLSSWPSGAQTIINASGIRSAYSDAIPKRVVVDDASMTFAGGGWTNASGLSTVNYSAGTSSYSQTTNATASYTFDGSALRIYGTKQNNLGVVRISIDGGPELSVDLYSGIPRHGQLLYENEQLKPGPHTVTMRVNGTKNPASSGYYGQIDHITYLPGTTRDNPSFSFTGAGWVHATGLDTNQYHAGTVSYSNQAGNTASYTMNGTRVELYGALQNNLGIMGVRIDGGPEQLVDLYSSTARYGVRVFSRGGLTPGNHTITLRATGTKNAASSGTFASFDRLVED